MRHTTILVAALLAACAHIDAPQPATNTPRDLLLIVDTEGNKILLQSVVTNCQAPWHRAIYTTRAGHSTIGCWRNDKAGNVIVDMEDGSPRIVVPVDKLQPAGPSSNSGGTT